MKTILLINGPNLNLLGKREPSIYGNKNLEQIEQELVSNAQKANCSLECFQSNSESKIVDLFRISQSQLMSLLLILEHTHTQALP